MFPLLNFTEEPMNLVRFLHAQFNYLSVQRCILCDAPGSVDRALCQTCYEELPFNRLACMRCATPIVKQAKHALCGACLQAPPPQRLTVAAFQYKSPLDTWIQALKFTGKLHYARLLGSMLAEELRRRKFTKPDVILPVPLHPSRQRRRGFNQAIEITRVVSRELHIPINFTDCRRLRATEHQSRLPAKLRKRNVARAFSFTAETNIDSVAIVDDVMTTGHTIQEVAHCVHQAGIEDIQVWCIAKA